VPAAAQAHVGTDRIDKGCGRRPCWDLHAPRPVSRPRRRRCRSGGLSRGRGRLDSRGAWLLGTQRFVGCVVLVPRLDRGVAVGHPLPRPRVPTLVHIPMGPELFALGRICPVGHYRPPEPSPVFQWNPAHLNQLPSSFVGLRGASTNEQEEQCPSSHPNPDRDPLDHHWRLRGEAAWSRPKRRRRRRRRRGRRRGATRTRRLEIVPLLPILRALRDRGRTVGLLGPEAVLLHGVPESRARGRVGPAFRHGRSESGPVREGDSAHATSCPSSS
jgi:hypothetical protein